MGVSFPSLYVRDLAVSANHLPFQLGTMCPFFESFPSLIISVEIIV